MLRIPANHSLFEDDLAYVSDQLAHTWPALEDGHLFITGGTGFFGIWLVEALLWAIEKRGLKLQITLLSRSPETFLARFPYLKGRAALHFVRGGVVDFERPRGPFTHIIHAASETQGDSGATWAERHFNSALYGTQRVLDLAAAHRSQAVLLTTSGAVYLPMDPILGDHYVEAPLGISDYTSEKVVYGQAKRTMEIMTAIGAQAHGYRALIARCFAFVGPYLALDSNYAIGNFMRDVLSQKDIVVSGDGTAMRSYLYAADLVVWLMTILVKGRSGYPYNVGGDIPISIGQLAQAVGREGENTSVIIRGTPVPDARPQFYVPDVKRAREDLGLHATIDLQEGIRRTLAWHRARATRI